MEFVIRVFLLVSVCLVVYAAGIKVYYYHQLQLSLDSLIKIQSLSKAIKNPLQLYSYIIQIYKFHIAKSFYESKQLKLTRSLNIWTYIFYLGFALPWIMITLVALVEYMS